MSDERRSRLDLDALASEAVLTLRAIQALNLAETGPGREPQEHHRNDARTVAELPERSPPDPYLRESLRARLDALGDIASFEPAHTSRQAAFQLMLAIPCVEIVKGEAFSPDLTPELRSDLERQAEKASRLLYSAAAVLIADPDLSGLRDRFCDPSDNVNAATDQILSAL